MFETAIARQRALVVHPVLRDARADSRSPEEKLEEARGLAEAINLDIIDALPVNLPRIRPQTLLGAGKVDEIKVQVAADDIQLAIVDTHLTPVQQRNLERAWKCKVIDRTALILEIFGERAKTREGTLQVELAALEYQKSRLVRSWTHLERQRGGLGFVGGPGETQIEADRRIIGERITLLKKQLDKVRKTRALHRKSRKKVPYPVIALVGYTNAGKSTLFNRLTGSKVMAEDQLFATLDPTLRAIVLPSGRKVILSDTVGFVSDLPTQLVAAFRATLEEVNEADLLLHVRDMHSSASEAQKADVLHVLNEMGMEERLEEALIEVWNKVDLLPAEEKATLETKAAGRDNRVAVSAVTGEGCEALLQAIDAWLERENQVMTFTLRPEEGKKLAWLHRHGSVLEMREQDGLLWLRASLPPEKAAKFAKL